MENETTTEPTMEEAVAMAEDAGFNVHDEEVLGDFSNVKDAPSVVPPSSDALVEVIEMSLIDNGKKDDGKAPDTWGIRVTVKLVDGVDVLDKESGETEKKYAGFRLNTFRPLDLCYKAKMDVPTRKGGMRANNDWWKNRQHQVQFRLFYEALGNDIKNVVINDEFLTESVGKLVRVNIGQESRQVLDQATGQYVDSGQLSNTLSGWKSAE